MRILWMMFSQVVRKLAMWVNTKVVMGKGQDGMIYATAGVPSRGKLLSIAGNYWCCN